MNFERFRRFARDEARGRNERERETDGSRMNEIIVRVNV